jgi:hypothetical protein
VDGQLLTQFQSQFPPWAVPFFHDEPGTERARHARAIDDFRRTLGRGISRPLRQYVPKRATVIGGNEPVLRDAANHVAAILRSADYTSAVRCAASMDEAFDDIDVFESMLDSEVCVFVLGKDLSYSDLYLAMRTRTACRPCACAMIPRRRARIPNCQASCAGRPLATSSRSSSRYFRTI